MSDALPAGWLFLGFNWNVDPFAASKLAEYLGWAQNDKTPGITLLLHCMGGSPEQALYLNNLIRSFPIPIHTHNMSTVQSAGNLLYLAGHKRFADPNATFMFHKTVFNLQSGSLTPEQLSLQTSGIKNSDQITLDRLTEVTGHPESVFANILAGDRLYPAIEAQKLGIVETIRPLYMPPNSRFVQIKLDSPKA